MIKGLLFSSFLVFSSGSALLNKAPFYDPNKQNESGPVYYEDYIDLNVFNNLEFQFVSTGGGSVNYFLVRATALYNDLSAKGIYLNDFKYWDSRLYLYNANVDLSVSISNRSNWDFTYSFSNYRNPVDIDRFGYSLVSSVFYENEFRPIYYATTWLDFELAHLGQSAFYIKFLIPYGSKTQPVTDYANELKKMRFFNQNYYDKVLVGLNDYDNGYSNGYTDGLNDGYIIGENDGFDWGFDVGYNNGYDAGLAADFNSFSWLTAIFSAMGGLLGIQLLPNVSIGGIAVLVMVLTLLPFLIGLLKGGKD